MYILVWQRDDCLIAWRGEKKEASKGVDMK